MNRKGVCRTAPATLGLLLRCEDNRVLSSGLCQRLISSFSKAKTIAFFSFWEFFSLKNFKIFWGKKSDFFFNIFPGFSRLFFSGLGSTGELWSKSKSRILNIERQRDLFLWFLYFLTFCLDFLDFSIDFFGFFCWTFWIVGIFWTFFYFYFSFFLT